jgi:hypothetical protein
VRYLQAGKKLSSPANSPGLTVRLLEPPRDENFLAKMDPPADQRFLQMDYSGAGAMQNYLEPNGGLMRKN